MVQKAFYLYLWRNLGFLLTYLVRNLLERIQQVQRVRSDSLKLTELYYNGKTLKLSFPKQTSNIHLASISSPIISSYLYIYSTTLVYPENKSEL
jgi:hypothetical protein